MTFKYSDKIFKRPPPTHCKVACEDGIRQLWDGVHVHGLVGVALQRGLRLKGFSNLSTPALSGKVKTF